MIEVWIDGVLLEAIEVKFNFTLPPPYDLAEPGLIEVTLSRKSKKTLAAVFGKAFLKPKRNVTSPSRRASPLPRRRR
jgi:hypothetical protein